MHESNGIGRNTDTRIITTIYVLRAIFGFSPHSTHIVQHTDTNVVLHEQYEI